MTILTVYLAAVGLGGRFVAMDEIAFKAAGREWANTGRFATPELAGFGQLHPAVEDVWLAQMPVYTFGFGLFTKLFGFSPRTCWIFDAGIHSLLVLLTFWLGKRCGAHASFAALGAILILPVGTIGRADELGACLVIAALLCLMSEQKRKSLYSLFGLLIAFTAGTSPGAIFCACILSLAMVQWRRETRVLLRHSAYVAGGVAVGLLLIAGPYLIFRPDAAGQFLEHAGRQLGLDWLAGIQFSWAYGKTRLLLAAALLAGSAFYRITNLSRDVTALWIGSAICLGILLTAFPTKFLYCWFVGPPLLVVWSVALQGQVQSRRYSLAVLTFFIVAGGVALDSTRFLVETLHPWTLPAEQTLAYNRDYLLELIPEGKCVMTYQHWWTLANRNPIASFDFSEAPPESIDYILLSAGGTGAPGVPEQPRPPYALEAKNHFSVAWDNLPREPVRHFGIPFTRSSYGYGCIVLKRDH